MFDIKYDKKGEIILQGRFDASQVGKAKSIFETIESTTITDFDQLDYISSAGLSVLLVTQKRLKDNGYELILKNMNKHIREVFKYAGFDMVFKIE
jgi:anti-sigma B factor antagonist